MQKAGIDVSAHQGVIDWSKLKGKIDFAILKAGGSDCGRYRDYYFEENYASAKANGIKVGCYYFMGRGCTSSAAGAADAQHFLSLISGKVFDYPCYADVEAQIPSMKAGTTDATLTFCSIVQSAGFATGVYASDISGFKDRLDLTRLNGLDKWVARYGSTPKYVKEYQLWQTSSSGSVPGISGRCDMDLSYKDYSNFGKESYILNGVDYSVVFDPEYYYNKYSDLVEAFGNNHSMLWLHFCTFGMIEGRQASEGFNVTAYHNRYEDLRNVYGDNLSMYYWHYCYFGKNEGRTAV